jgi:Rrf2 family protein
MKLDSRLSSVLHVLLHMAEHETPMTSELLARAMHTNPVVVRRVLAGLREHGYVRSDRGHGGGWTLACQLNQVSLLDVYTALGEPTLLAMGHRTESPGCLVELAVNSALDDAFRTAEAQLRQRLSEVTLAMLASDFRTRMRAHRTSNPQADPNAH